MLAGDICEAARAFFRQAVQLSEQHAVAIVARSYNPTRAHPREFQQRRRRP